MPVTDQASRRGARCFAAWLVLAAAMTSQAIAQDEPCEVFAESFDSFVGPHDHADELLDIRWCLDGASVATGGFCVGGNALKLSSSSDEATLRVQILDDACAEVTLRFVYSQFAETGTVLRHGTSSAARSLCNTPLPTIVGELNVIGGACIEVTHTVAISPGQALLWRFDHGQPGNTAIYIDDLSIEVAGCCGGATEHSCCDVGPAGCVDEEVMQCVCAIDTYCCETEWDAQCVALVEQLECGTCDEAGGEDCAASFAIDFGEMFSSDSICQQFPALFTECGGVGAPFLTNSGGCAGVGDAALTFATGFPHSYAQTGCVDLSTAAEATLTFNYTKTTGTLGPSVQVVHADETVETIWTAPIVFAGGCAAAEIDLAAYLGSGPVRLRFSSGSSIANGASIDDLVFTASDVSSHGCCEVGEPGCADAAVESCVCAIDSFCCEEAWDELCVISAEFYACDDCDLCSESFAADFDVPDPGGTPCDRYPDLFAGCFGSGPLLSNATPCSADASDYAVVFVVGSDVSSLVTRCISLADVAAASITFEYSKIDGQIGPIIEASADVGNSWVPLWVAPDAPGPGSHAGCVDLEPAVGLNFLLFRFRAGEVGAAGQVIDDIVFETGNGCPVLPGDVTGDGQVDLADLLAVIGNWGLLCPPESVCQGDATGDGLVDLADLLLVIGNWGSSV